MSCSAATRSSAPSGSSVSSSAITSSLIQLVSKASRASRAVVTASWAVKQPAVLGRIRRPDRPTTSRNELAPDGSRRRSAMVTISVPDASSARSRMSRLGAPPVPMINRDLKRSPAMIRKSSTSTTLDRVEDLEPVPGEQRRIRPAGAKYHVAIARHRDPPLLGRELHLTEQVGQAQSLGHFSAFAVDDDDHAPTPAVRRNRDGDHGRVASGQAPPASTPATASAVAGARR